MFAGFRIFEAFVDDGFGPAISSSSNMDDDARSPRTSLGLLAGFFLRYSSVKGFAGALKVSGFFLPNPKRNVRRCTHGIVKVGVLDENVTATAVYQHT